MWWQKALGPLGRKHGRLLDADGSQEVKGSPEAGGWLESWQKQLQPPALPAGGTQERTGKVCLARGASGISVLMRSLESSPHSHQEPFLFEVTFLAVLITSVSLVKGNQALPSWTSCTLAVFSTKRCLKSCLESFLKTNFLTCPFYKSAPFKHRIKAGLCNRNER